MPTIRIPLVGSFNQRGMDGNAAIVIAGKECKKCNTWKEASLFGKRNGRKIGLQHWCKGCKKKYDEINKDHNKEVLRQWYLKNKDRHRALQKLWTSKNKERMNELHRKYREEDPISAILKAKEWRDKNREKFRATHRHHSAMRRGLIRGQKIAASYKESISKIYAECPKGFHVDHMVPIKGKTVCGLHVPWNLQYLPASENKKKWNRYADD